MLSDLTRWCVFRARIQLLRGILFVATALHLDAPTTEEEAKELLLSHFAIRVGSDSRHAAMNEVDTCLSQIAVNTILLPTHLASGNNTGPWRGMTSNQKSVGCSLGPGNWHLLG